MHVANIDLLEHNKCSKETVQSVLNLIISASFCISIVIISCNCLSSTSTSLQVTFNVMLPVERFVTQRACVAAHLGMPRVGVRTQVGLIEEASPTDAAEVLVGAGVQAPVLHVARVREERFAARLTRLVGSQFGLCA